jgi:predicted metal-dependent peptidase
MTATAQNLISASILRLRMKSPFFATLAMFARFLPTQECPTAATDGKDIFYNEDFIRSLPPKQVDGLLLHEVLHAALLHCTRRNTREPQIWNIAADIVINGMIAQESAFELPPGGLREPKLENYTVEEVYELLLKSTNLPKLANLDLLNQAPSDIPGSNPQLTPTEKAALEAHWRNALQQAKLIAQSSKQGTLPAGIQRELDRLTTPQIDWRSYLWRYLTQTPNDFQGFDRRFIGQGLYLETLSGESVKVYVAIDTSGSIDGELLRIFLSEVQGILNAYPHLKCDLYYADAAVYGPYEVEPDRPMPAPEGGGGTSFVPFFDAIAKVNDRQTAGLAIYLTDGYGDFPDAPPEIPTLWVVTAGGLDLDQFPFGETVRLLDDRQFRISGG